MGPGGLQDPEKLTGPDHNTDDSYKCFCGLSTRTQSGNLLLHILPPCPGRAQDPETRHIPTHSWVGM